VTARATVAAAGLLLLQATQAPPPPTEVFLTNMSVDASPLVGRSVALNISNNPGYDNQPSFTSDNKSVLFSSNRDGKQTDIYRYDIDGQSLTQLTHTAESEYSPLATPDGTTFSVVRVESDGAQRLWRFDMDGSNPRLVLRDVKPVGYHAWIDRTHVALFVLGAQGQPATLQIADTGNGAAKTVATNIGRSLQIRSRKGTLTFVSKAATPWVIKQFDLADGAITDLGPTIEGSEDFTWNSKFGSERLLMARGAKIFYRSPSDPTWREAGDLSAAGLGSITRLAVRAEGQPALALVAEPTVK